MKDSAILALEFFMHGHEMLAITFIV